MALKLAMAIDKALAGLGNVANILQIGVTEKGSPNGVTPLNSVGTIDLQYLPAESKALSTKATIAERDAISAEDRYEGMYVLVEDASADSSVTSGSAQYRLKADLTTWFKTGEGESMDIDFSPFFRMPSHTLDDLTQGSENKHFTASLLTKLMGIAVGATANATDALLRQRSSHTGTQLAATISDFVSAATTVVQSVLDARVVAPIPQCSESSALPASSHLFCQVAMVSDVDGKADGIYVSDGAAWICLIEKTV